MKKINMLVIGDAVVPTGFSRVLHSIIKYLPKSDYNISWIGVNYYGDPHDYPYKIYPATLMDRMDLYGFSRIEKFADQNIDIIFILNDAWIIDNYLKVIKKVFKPEKMPKIFVYVPVDAYDHSSSWYKDFDIVTKTVAYTQFGREEIKRATNNSIDPIIIPHGVDTDIFYTLPEGKAEIRKKLYPKRPDIYEDGFIILNGNRNQPRKKVDISIRAFAMFAENKPENVKFYYHGGIKDQGVDIVGLSKRYGLHEKDRLIVSTTTPGTQTLPIEMLNKIYNICDIGVNTSLGEGWGLVAVEHAVTGAAQILPYHSACKEIFSDCGLMIRPIVPLLIEGIDTTGFLVRAEDIANAYEMLYTKPELRKEISDKAKAKFTSPEYSWRNISKTWDTLFKEGRG